MPDYDSSDVRSYLDMNKSECFFRATLREMQQQAWLAGYIPFTWHNKLLPIFLMLSYMGQLSGYLRLVYYTTPDDEIRSQSFMQYILNKVDLFWTRTNFTPIVSFLSLIYMKKAFIWCIIQVSRMKFFFSYSRNLTGGGGVAKWLRKKLKFFFSISFA